jgi:hypothetical protein
METSFKLRGDSLDSKKDFLRATLSLQRRWNVEEFLEAPNVTDPEPFSDHAGTKEKQKSNLNNFYDALSNMAGTITVETVRDSIEENTYENVDLTTVTRKARQLLRYYATLVQPNSVKDSSLTTKRNLLNFTNKDSSKLKQDLERLFNEFEEIEKEMTPRTKMVELAKMEYFTGMLSTNAKILSTALEDIDIMDEATTFEDFKKHLLKSAEKIGTRIRNERTTQSRTMSSTDTIMSSNSTIESVNSTTVTVDKDQYDRMEEALRRSKRERSNSERAARQAIILTSRQ